MSLSSLLRTCPENETSKVFCDHGGALTLLSKLRTKSIGRKNSGPVQWCNDDEFGDEGVLISTETKQDEQGLNLLTLLLECVAAILVDNLGKAQRMLLELT